MDTTPAIITADIIMALGLFVTKPEIKNISLSRGWCFPEPFFRPTIGFALGITAITAGINVMLPKKA